MLLTGLRKTLVVTVTIITGVLMPVPVAGGEYVRQDDFNQQMAQLVMKMARLSIDSTVSGKPFEFELPAGSPLGTAINGVSVVLIKDGKIISESSANQTTFAGNIRLAAARAAALTEESDVKQSSILVSVMFKPLTLDKEIPPLLYHRISALGLHGIKAEFRGFSADVSPLTPVLRGWSWNDTMKYVARQLEADREKREGKDGETKRLLLNVLMDPGFKITLYPSLTVAKLAGGDNVEILYRHGKLVNMADVDRKAVLDAIARAEKWYEANQQNDGSFPYVYNPLDSSVRIHGNVVREAMNVAAVGLLWSHTRNNGTRRMGIRALKELLTRTYLEDPRQKFGYLRDGEKVTLGASAAALLAIVRLRAGADNKAFLDRREKFVAFLKAMRGENGEYVTIYPPDEKQSGVDYYPGEAQLAMMEYNTALNGAPETDGCLLSMNFYKSYFWNAVNKERHPPYPFIPWHTQANVRIYATTRRQEIASDIFSMNKILTGIQQIYSDSTSYVPIDERGRFFNPEKRATGKPHVSSTAVYLEGLADAFVLARSLGDEKAAAQFRGAILWGVRNLLQLQIKDEYDMIVMPDKKRSLGGFRTGLARPWVRIDNMQHAVCALVKVAAVFKDEDFAKAKKMSTDN